MIEARAGGAPGEAVMNAQTICLAEADAAVSWATAQRIEHALPPDAWRLVGTDSP